MSTESPSKWEKSVERKESVVRRRAMTLLNDSSHDWLRTASARRAVVALYVIASGVMVVLWARSSQLPALLAMAGWGVLLIALRLSVRSQADLPDYVLDERQRAVRDRTYLDAYRLVGAVVVIAAAVALGVVVSRDQKGAGSISLNYGQATAMFWGAMALLLGAPSLMLALKQSNEP